VAALLVERLEKFHVRWVDYPNLIRLNPNVPWKTRGNGALCLRFECCAELLERVREEVLSVVEEQAEIENRMADPGVVFFRGEGVPADIEAFAQRTIKDLVTLRQAISLVRKYGAEAFGWNVGRGIIGALAAVGETLMGDHTFELIAYRRLENYGSKRMIDEASVYEMDLATQPFTFNNVDAEKHRVIITPHGPDPILLGIRGETPEAVKNAFKLVKTLEPVERWMIFRSNQGTDAHLQQVSTLSQIKPYTHVIAKAYVSRNPWIVPLRHVLFSVSDGTAEVDCAAYEPTGKLRKIARKLAIGDYVEVYGAVRRPEIGRRLTVNLEKLKLLALASEVIQRNPQCPKCGRRLKSMGKGKGYRCKACGTRVRHAGKIRAAVDRCLELGLYVTSTRSQRHLTKPLRRYGLEKTCKKPVVLVEEWHSRF
jgi:tRNA(Ile2)-agmatinylcytidine synthase